jgi:hypothetical protein
MLVSMSFGEKWIKWTIGLVEGGSISIRMNDQTSQYFKPRKGLR